MDLRLMADVEYLDRVDFIRYGSSGPVASVADLDVLKLFFK
ncbi:MAG: hypothetical protein BWY78_01328 [Alphaproteobacteria bacterium ADurb.Bin438]|nr:MAG: hypothetical protein BWY78_01328 [Alphaproteobacteria bacterium ADurb.Bin438]